MLKTKAGDIVGTAAAPGPNHLVPKLLRFTDLQALGLVGNWVTLGRWIEREGFPKGRLLGANIRCWTEAEIADWIASRPADRSEVA